MRYYHHPESQSVMACTMVQPAEPGLEPIDRADYLTLRFYYAVVAYAFIGAAHPDAHEEIESELEKSRAKLLEALRNPKANR